MRIRNAIASSAVAVLVGAGLLSACTRPQAQVVDTDEVECTLERNGSPLFTGTRDCLSALPEMEISGYWVVGHEYSVLYTDRDSIVYGYDENATWLELSSEAYSQVAGRLSGSPQIFEVRFMGTRSTLPGIYGNGIFPSGALMNRITDLKELPSGAM